MQRTVWAVKRAYWRSWTGMVRLLRTGGMFEQWPTRKVTPARYDILHLLVKRGGTMVQNAMREALGLAKSSLSEILSIMERLGFIERSRFRPRVGRTVTLTKSGEDAYSWTFMIEMEVDRDVTRAFGYSDRRQLHVEKACLTVRSAFDEIVGPRMLYKFFVIDD